MRSIALLLACAVPALSCIAADPGVGRWEGALKIPGRELPVVVDLAQDDAGGWSGSVVLPGLNVKGAPLSGIKSNGPTLDFAIGILGSATAPARFSGRIDPPGTMAGDFSQGGNSAPFVLARTGPPQVDVPPRSTRVRGELEGTWRGSYELGGYPRQVTIKLANGDAAASVDWTIVGKQTTKIPVDLITQQDDFLRIEANQFGLTYEGRVGRDAEEIRGTFEQGPLSLPLVLRRGGKD